MSRDIFDYPPVEQKYVAVRRFILTIGGEKFFNRLLNHLGLTREEFTLKYGEELIGNPSLFNKELIMIVSNDFKAIRGSDDE